MNEPIQRLDVFSGGNRRVRELEAGLSALLAAIAAGGFDVSPCRSCGTPVVGLPDGLPWCKACAEKAG